MKQINALHEHDRRWIARVRRLLHQAPFAWVILLLLVTLSLLPFVLLDKPQMRFEVLAPLLGLGILSIAVAAWLRARAGAMIAWLLVVSGFFLTSLHANGPAWMIQVDGNTLFSVALGFLITALALGQLRSVGQKLASAHAIIQRQALTDALTGLPNHRAVIDQLEKEVERARRYGRPFSLLFFDADRFKHVNDTHGHAVGDVVLRQIGERAGSVLRGGDTLGRFGGEEFVILLPEADMSEARTVAERIRATVAASPMATSEVAGGIIMTVSMGLVGYPQDGHLGQDLLSQADEAMYFAKRLGRNQVRLAEEARQAVDDPVLMALLQDAGRSEAAERAGLSSEQSKRASSVKMVFSLMSLIELRDHGMSAHSHAVSDLATAIAQAMGVLPQQVQLIGTAGLVHDIGKVGIPDALLQHAGRFSANERSVIRLHPEVGAEILSASLSLQDLVPAVRHHHERWDGEGYPDQLRGTHIPLAARIIAVAEAYDAIGRGSSYQASRSQEEAVAELRRGAGTQFDPAVVQALLAILTQQHVQEQTMQAAGA